MNPKQQVKRIFKLLGIAIVVIIIGAILFLYFVFRNPGSGLILEKQTPPATLSELSEEELTALWANGERCSEENFPKFSRFANSFQDEGVTVSVNTMDLYLEHDGSCKDVEYIAQLVGAQIAHFDTFIRPQSDYITGSYYLKLSINSIVELEIAVEKIKALNNNPRIKSRFISVFGSTQDFRE